MGISFETVKSLNNRILSCWPHNNDIEWAAHRPLNCHYDYFESEELHDGTWMNWCVDIKECFNKWTVKEISNFLKEDTKIRMMIYNKFKEQF